MSFFKRAVMATTRRKGKSLVLLVIFFAIANMVLAGFAIQDATDSASVLARQQLGGQLTLRYDVQSAMQKARDAGEQRPRIQSEPITEAMATMVAKQKDIIGYNYLVNASGLADGFEAVAADTTTTQQETTDNQASGPMRNGMGDGNGNGFVAPDVTVTGVSSSALADAFYSSGAKLVSGRAINPSDAGSKTALIEQNLADQNSIKVGDKITVKATRSDTSVEYTVVGIYQTGSTGSESQTGMRDMGFNQPYNQILVDYQSAIPLKTVTSSSGTSTGGIDAAVFFVNDPKNIDQVKTDVKAMKIDWTKYTFDANDRAYQQMMGPIETVAGFAKIVVYVVAIAGALILALLLLLSMRERVYETGVLLSMGEGKVKIIAQYVVEVLIVAVIAFGLSTFSGKVIAQDAGNLLLSREVAAQQSQTSNGMRAGGIGFDFNRGGLRDAQAIDNINVDITTSEMEQLAAAGLLIMAAGTILPAASLLRYKPRNILTRTT